MNSRKKTWITLLASTALAVAAAPAVAHELWIEAPVTGQRGEELSAHVYWGHSGKKPSSEAIASLGDRLIARRAGPEGPAEPIALTREAESFVAKFTPAKPGYQTLGAELENGILDKELHGIPARTRLVMYGKSLIHVAGSDDGLAQTLGMELELVPVGPWKNLRPGEVVTVQVRFKGKPLGGRNVVVSLHTIGNLPLQADERIDGLQWTVEDHPDPRTGEVSFPLIVAGQHLFLIRYTDETPGRYEGDREVTTKISHMRKGDTYDRFLHIATLTADIRAQ